MSRYYYQGHRVIDSRDGGIRFVADSVKDAEYIANLENRIVRLNEVLDEAENEKAPGAEPEA